MLGQVFYFILFFYFEDHVCVFLYIYIYIYIIVGDELDSGLKPKGPKDHNLRDGAGPKMWIGVRVLEE